MHRKNKSGEFIMNMKSILTYFLTLTILISLVGCKNDSFTINDNYIEDSYGEINYNNIYQFSHSNFWVNEGAVYYAKSGLYNDTFYFTDKDGKHKIISNSQFNTLNKVKGKISDIQAYGDNIYLLFANEDNTFSFYLYNKSEKNFKQIFHTKENVNDWAVVDNQLVYSAFLQDKNINVNSLWIYDITAEKNEKIDAETTAFGIVNGDILYVKKEADKENLLYKYNTKKRVSDFLYSFNHNSETYNDYNFTEKYLTFFENGLNVLNLENGLVNTHQLPGYAKFMSCYMDYAFICLEEGIYRINLSTGETEMLFSDFDECHLIHAISDECVITVCYENLDSLFGSSVRTYAVNSNGSTKALFDI